MVAPYSPDKLMYWPLPGKYFLAIELVEEAPKKYSLTLVAYSGVTHVNFWHAWHTRDFASGLRRDTVTIDQRGQPAWSHQGLTDTSRYEGTLFC